MSKNPFVGKWTYRSFLNEPVLNTDPKALLSSLMFGDGTIVIDDGPTELLTGTIGGDGWSLKLRGSRGYGSPSEVRFQGKGVVGGAEWIYAYVGWLVPTWPNSTDTLDRPAIVGSVVRVIPHPGSNGATNPAGVVASFYAVRAD
jgi:hypothetical protein